jgi:hypothetical protein
MPPTYPQSTRLESVYPGLRIVEKFHKPNAQYPDLSYEVIAGLKGQSGTFVPLDPKKKL